MQANWLRSGINKIKIISTAYFPYFFFCPECKLGIVLSSPPASVEGTWSRCPTSGWMASNKRGQKMVAFDYGHTHQKAPYPVRSAKLSWCRRCQYCGRGRHGNTTCCSLFDFLFLPGLAAGGCGARRVGRRRLRRPCFCPALLQTYYFPSTCGFLFLLLL